MLLDLIDTGNWEVEEEEEEKSHAALFLSSSRPFEIKGTDESLVEPKFGRKLPTMTLPSAREGEDIEKATRKS